MSRTYGAQWNASYHTCIRTCTKFRSYRILPGRALKFDLAGIVRGLYITFWVIRLWTCRAAAVILPALDDLDVADPKDFFILNCIVVLLYETHIEHLRSKRVTEVRIIRLHNDSNNQGYHVTELSRVLVPIIFVLLCGDIDVNMQGIKGAMQSSPARARDTCVISDRKSVV